MSYWARISNFVTITIPALIYLTITSACIIAAKSQAPYSNDISRVPSDNYKLNIQMYDQNIGKLGEDFKSEIPSISLSGRYEEPQQYLAQKKVTTLALTCLKCMESPSTSLTGNSESHSTSLSEKDSEP